MTSITTNLTQITPDLAKEYLSFIYDSQRPLNKNHVSYLADAMTNVLFDPTSTIAFVLLNGEKILVDGQHTLNAIIKSGVPQNMLVANYLVTTQEEVARLYSHFNIGKGRSFSDSVRAYGIMGDMEMGINNINRMASALRFMKAGFPSATSIKEKYQHEYMIELIGNWIHQGHAFFESINGSDYRIRLHLKSMSIMSVGLVILKYSPDEGVRFLELAHDNGLKKGDPRRAFLYYLRKIALTNQSGRRVQTQGQISRAFAKCWGKHLDELSLNNIQISKLDSVNPIVIKGTPYTGKFRTVG